MKYRIFTFYFELGLLLLMLSLGAVSLNQSNAKALVIINDEQSEELSQLTSHAPIVISANSGFSALGFPGNGSESNPCLIEDLEIVGSASIECIFIGSSVTAHYKIRECRVSDSFPGASIILGWGHGLVKS